MANIGNINKIVKLHKLALITSFHGYVQPTSTAILALSNKFARLVDNQTKLSSHSFAHNNVSDNIPQYKLTPYRSYSTKPTEQNTATGSATIDEFRAREEEKEKEFTKLQEEPPPEENNKEKVESVRLKILEASLLYVSNYGWTRKAIAQGAEAAGYPGTAHGMFPNGGIELITHFYSKCNDRLVDILKEETQNDKTETKNHLDFLVRAVKIRLQMIEPYIAHWPQAIAIMSLPQNVPTSLAQLLTLVDDICYYSGDRSVDFGWYTRRVGLATIYKMTELYMLQDSSIDRQSTWNFLKNRMEEATQLEAIMAQSEGLSQNVQKTLSSAFTTARNILGVGYDRR